MERNIKVIKSEKLSKKYESRFVIIDVNTEEVLDDAQGYGYKTAQKSHAAWNYKNRDKSKDAEKLAQKRHIQKWMKEHKGFISYIDAFAFDLLKDTHGNEKLNPKHIQQMLDEEDLHPDFTARELLKVYLGPWK